MSPKHLQRYVNELCWRQNTWGPGTLGRMGHMVRGMRGKRLTYLDLIAKKGPGSFAI